MGRLSKELNLEMTWIFDLDKVPKSGGAVTKKQLLNAGTWGHVTTPARLNFTLTKDPVLQINYPEGTYRSPGTVDGSMGGAQFYADPLSPKQRGLLEFSVYFPADFPFHLGGKLPGLYGSIPGSSDFSDCSGGSPANGTNCWSIRLMWRARGAGEVCFSVLIGAFQNTQSQSLECRYIHTSRRLIRNSSAHNQKPFAPRTTMECHLAGVHSHSRLAIGQISDFMSK